MVKRAAAARNARTIPLTPEEMWKDLVLAHRGFNASRSGPGDDYRSTPATLPKSALDLDPDGIPIARGARPGKGYETYGAIQILDADGKRVSVDVDWFQKGEHAEDRILRKPDKSTPRIVPGGKMMVVVDQEVCDRCRGKLIKFAEQRKLKVIERYHPERTTMRGTRIVTPKTAMRTATMRGFPEVRIVARPPIVIKTGAGLKGMVPKSAIKGTLVGIIAGIGATLLSNTCRAAVLDDLRQMPSPKIDRRSGEKYFGDPNVQKGMKTADVLHRDLSKLTQRLREKHAKLGGQATLEIMLLQASGLSDDDRADYFFSMDEELDTYIGELRILKDNVAALMGLEPQLSASAKAASELVTMFAEGFLMQALFNSGFTVEQISQMYTNLKSYDARIRHLFQDARALATRWT